MPTLTVYPGVLPNGSRCSVLAQDGVTPIPNSGAVVGFSDYYLQKISAGILLDKDPINSGGTPIELLVAPLTLSGIPSIGNVPVYQGSNTLEWSEVPTGGPIDVNAHGVLPENTATVNGAAMRSMRDLLLATDPNAHWTMQFGRRGTYAYDENKWLNGFLDYTVDLNGSTLEYYQPAGSALTADTNTMLVWPDPWLVFNDGPNWNVHGFTYHEGYRIATVDAASAAVVLLDADKAAYLTAGEPVMIAGWAVGHMQYPNAMEAFEFNFIESVVGTTVTLQNRTRHRYSQDWPATVGRPHCGPATLYKLRNRKVDPDVASYDWTDMPRRATWRNGRLQGTRVGGANVFYVAGYESVRMENLSVNALTWFVNGDNASAYNCSWYGSQKIPEGINALEVDKNITNLLFENCRIPYIGGATSVKNLSMRNCTVDSVIETQAKRQVFENVVVAAKSASLPTFLIPNRATFRNVSAAAPPGTPWLQPQDWVSRPTVSIASINGSDNSLVTFNEFPSPDLPRFRLNDYLIATDGSIHGKVIDSLSDRSFRVRWSGTPAVSQQFYHTDDWAFTVDGASGTTLRWPTCIPSVRGGSAVLASPEHAGTVSLNVFFVPTMITSIVVSVTKASATFGFVQIRGYGGTPNLVHIDCATTGTRTITSGGVDGIAGLDYQPFGSGANWLDASAWTNLSSYRPRIRIDASAGSSLPKDWPVWTLTINCKQLEF